MAPNITCGFPSVMKGVRASFASDRQLVGMPSRVRWAYFFPLPSKISDYCQWHPSMSSPHFGSSSDGLLFPFHTLFASAFICSKWLVNSCVWGEESKGWQRLQPTGVLRKERGL
jgi:hypothetical protein